MAHTVVCHNPGVTFVNQTSPPRGSMHVELEVSRSDALLWTPGLGEQQGT